MDAFWQSEFWRVFKQNFIEENRWTYLASGLQTTLIVTLLALLMGILLGGLVAILRVMHDKEERPGRGLRLADAVCRLYLTLIRGTPMMLQLLIMYFVIFGSVKIDKTVTAVLAFGINSGAYLAEIFRSGIMSIDPGQTEAGRSLGLPYRVVMARIILPQAVKNVLPALVNELIALLKETSIVGYIGLRDLTRGADVIRSQTWVAFAPLLGAAAIYLLIVILLTKLAGRIERRLGQSDRG